MLHTDVVEAKTLGLLRSLQRQPLLADYFLVGGTALALYLGHRKSIDLDLFCSGHFDVEEVQRLLQDRYGFMTGAISQKVLMGHIDGVKVDCIPYPSPKIRPAVQVGGIRMLSPADIAAMKLAAISQDGSRLKDFVDVAYLSTMFSFQDMLRFYAEKYPKSSPVVAARAINYYDDIDFGAEVVMAGSDFDWRQIERRLEDMAQDPSILFGEAPDEILFGFRR